MGEYLAKLSMQREWKKDRRVKATFSSSFSGFSPVMPVPLCQLSSPCDNIVVISVALSAAFVVNFAASSPVVSSAPFAPPSGGVSGEFSRKRHREDSSSYTEKMEMWAVFEKIWAAHSCPASSGCSRSGSSLASCHSAFVRKRSRTPFGVDMLLFRLRIDRRLGFISIHRCLLGIISLMPIVDPFEIIAVPHLLLVHIDRGPTGVRRWCRGICTLHRGCLLGVSLIVLML